MPLLPFTETRLPLSDPQRGKVRDNYALSEERRLLITTP